MILGTSQTTRKVVPTICKHALSDTLKFSLVFKSPQALQLYVFHSYTCSTNGPINVTLSKSVLIFISRSQTIPRNIAGQHDGKGYGKHAKSSLLLRLTASSMDVHKSVIICFLSQYDTGWITPFDRRLHKSCARLAQPLWFVCHATLNYFYRIVILVNTMCT